MLKPLLRRVVNSLSNQQVNADITDLQTDMQTVEKLMKSDEMELIEAAIH